MTYLTHPDFNRAAHAAFLAACAASRADDTPRLVYADWLEEWGGKYPYMPCETCKRPDDAVNWVDGCILFPTEADARDALSEAILAVCMGRAGLG